MNKKIENTGEKIRLQEIDRILDGLLSEVTKHEDVSSIDEVKKLAKSLATDCETFRMGFIEQVQKVAELQELLIEQQDKVTELLNQKENLLEQISNLRGMK